MLDINAALYTCKYLNSCDVINEIIFYMHLKVFMCLTFPNLNVFILDS